MDSIIQTLSKYGKLKKLSHSPLRNTPIYNLETKYLNNTNDQIGFDVIIMNHYIVLTDDGWLSDNLYPSGTNTYEDLKMNSLINKYNVHYATSNMFRKYHVHQNDTFSIIDNTKFLDACLKRYIKSIRILYKHLG